jgi:type I restriction enzyme, S subunit
MITTNYKYLKIVEFKNLKEWQVSLYISDNSLNTKFNNHNLGELITPVQKLIKKVDYDGVTPIVSKVSFKDGKIHIRPERITGMNLYQLNFNDLLVSKINFHQGALSLNKLQTLNCSTHYQPYSINRELIFDKFLVMLLRSQGFKNYLETRKMIGIKNEFTFNQIKQLQIPLPNIETQEELVSNYESKINLAVFKKQQVKELENKIETFLMEELGIEIIQKEMLENGYKFLQFVELQNLSRWSIKKQLFKSKFDLATIENKYEYLGRGKSPKYSEESNDFILNQKCVRWFHIENQFAKKVDSKWLNSISKPTFTQENDILINSTGEGTIGRSAIVDKQNINILTDSHILLLRLKLTILNPTYYIYWFNSKENQFQLDQIKSAQTTKQTELGTDNLKKMLLPIPPIKIQNKIVAQIDIWKTEIKKLKLEAEELEIKAKSEFENAIFNKD